MSVKSSAKNNRRICLEVDKWKKYIDKFPEPKDDFQRLRFHYLCNVKYFPVFGRLLYTIAALFLYIPLFLLYCFRALAVKKIDDVDAILLCTNESMKELMSDQPKELLDEFPNQKYVAKRSTKRGGMLCGILQRGAVKDLMRLIIRYPFSVYMHFYMLIHMGYLCELIKKYSPKAIITIQTEFDFATTLLTRYCEKSNCEYICFEHGTYMLAPQRAFVRFSRYYAWSDEMVDMFKETRSPSDFFRIYQSGRLGNNYDGSGEHEFFITYYLQDQSADYIAEIRDVLAMFEKKGYRCRVRPHPRASDFDQVVSIFSDTSVTIEEPHEVSLKASVESSEYIVSSCSTVLDEALTSGLKAVIDDVTSFLPITVLKKLRYVTLDKIRISLSDLLAEYVSDKGDRAERRS